MLSRIACNRAFGSALSSCGNSFISCHTFPAVPLYQTSFRGAQSSIGGPRTLTAQKASRLRQVKALIESKRMKEPVPGRIIRGVIFGTPLANRRSAVLAWCIMMHCSTGLFRSSPACTGEPKQLLYMPRNTRALCRHGWNANSAMHRLS